MEKQKKSKKAAVLILLGMICVIAIIAVVCFLNNKNNKKDDDNIKNLAGERIASGLYVYNLEEKNSIQNLSVKDEKVYYLTNKENTYKLYEIDIYTNKTKEIGSVECDLCILKEDYLVCYKGEETVAYDIGLKEVYKSNKPFTIIPYQESFLIVMDKDIYLNNEKIRTIRDDIKDFDIIKYYVSKNNTFIQFVSANDSYIYNVKEDSYNKIDDEMYLYEKGMFYGANGKIIVKNLDDNLSKEYNNFKSNNDFSLGTVKDNLYIYIDNKYLKIYNLETNKFKYLDYKFEKSIDQMIIKDNYLYLSYQGENPQIYIVKLDEVDSKEYTINEYKDTLNR